MFGLLTAPADHLGMGPIQPAFNSIAYKASCAGRKNPAVKHYYRARNVKVRLSFRHGNTLGLKEGTVKKMDAVRLGNTLYFPASHGWRHVDKYARKVGAMILPD